MKLKKFYVLELYSGETDFEWEESEEIEAPDEETAINMHSEISFLEENADEFGVSATFAISEYKNGKDENREDSFKIIRITLRHIWETDFRELDPDKY